jgi:hypothetical protein
MHYSTVQTMTTGRRQPCVQIDAGVRLAMQKTLQSRPNLGTGSGLPFKFVIPSAFLLARGISFPMADH